MIMDGNKRWAKINNVSLKDGYLRGLQKIKEIVNFCLDQNLSHLTIYALSSENVKRPSVTTIFDTGIGKIELLKGMSTNSTIDQFIINKGLSIHHIALRVKNIKRLLDYLEKNNIELINKDPQIGAEGYLIAFIHPKATPGLLIELCER